MSHPVFSRVIEYLDAYHDSEIPIFYYIGIGTANYRRCFPEPNNRHEYPDYVRDLPYKKVLILIDPFTGIPLDGSGITLLCDVNEDAFSKYTSDNLDIYAIKQYISSDDNKIFIINFVNKALRSNDRSLVLIANYTGTNWYHYQNDFINEFANKFKNDVRNRFLIDSRYLNDESCYPELTNTKYQPIIMDGIFYNPGKLNPEEYNIHLTQLQHIDINFDRKKLVLYNMFFVMMNDYLNEEYRRARINCNEASGDMKIHHRNDMLKFVEHLMMSFGSIINVDEFINSIRFDSIYNDISTIKKLVNEIFSHI